MTIICSALVRDTNELAKILEILEGHNLSCQVYGGVMTVKFVGPQSKANEIMSLFENLARHEIIVLSQRAWKEDKK